MCVSEKCARSLFLWTILNIMDNCVMLQIFLFETIECYIVWIIFMFDGIDSTKYINYLFNISTFTAFTLYTITIIKQVDM